MIICRKPVSDASSGMSKENTKFSQEENKTSQLSTAQSEMNEVRFVV